MGLTLGMANFTLCQVGRTPVFIWDMERQLSFQLVTVTIGCHTLRRRRSQTVYVTLITISHQGPAISPKITMADAAIIYLGYQVIVIVIVIWV